jgi:hypothetical protein
MPASPVTSIFDSVNRNLLDRTASDEQTAFDAEAIDIDKIPARVSPKKVEWETPDDDIPSEAAVLQLLAKESPQVATPAQEPELGLEESPGRTAPVEMVQSTASKLNDIEPIALQKEEISQIPAVANTQENTVPEPVAVEKPVAIQAQTSAPTLQKTQPRVDKLPVTEKPVVAAPVEKVTSLPLPKRHAKKKPKAPPAVSQTPAVKKAEPVVAAAASAVVRASVEPTPIPKASTPPRKRSGIGFKVNLAEMEDITHVRPPSQRMRIEWERSVAQSKVSNIIPVQRPVAAVPEAAFVPTILGGAADHGIVARNPIADMFSGFSTRAESNESSLYQSALVAVAVVALIGLFLFGFATVTNYFQAASTDEAPQSAQTAGESPAPPVQAALPTLKTTTKNPGKVGAEAKPAGEAKPVAETAAVTDRPASVPEKPAVVKKADGKAKPESSKASSKPSATEPVVKTPAKSSAAKQPAVKTPAASPVKAKDSTRPRIVPNAKP